MKNAFEYEVELAALLEELATVKQSEYELKIQLYSRTQNLAAHKLSLTAAEQRNAASEHLLMLWYSENALGRINVDDSSYHVVTATAEHFDSKPSESGEIE